MIKITTEALAKMTGARLAIIMLSDRLPRHLSTWIHRYVIRTLYGSLCRELRAKGPKPFSLMLRLFYFRLIPSPRNGLTPIGCRPLLTNWRKWSFPDRNCHQIKPVLGKDIVICDWKKLGIEVTQIILLILCLLDGVALNKHYVLRRAEAEYQQMSDLSV